MSDFPTPGRLAAIDFGTVRIGIAITDPSRNFASPLENYNRTDLRGDELRFQRLVEEEDIVGFIVGLPINTDGRETPKSREARAFGDWLSEVTQIHVVYHDERFSTSMAHELMIAANVKASKRKKHLDMIAAQQILQSYLSQ
ncbi:MAG: Holliday junction resolvase RuvX [Pirellulaceae bacterium]|jgi:putative Holliday junction resolvase|nr:Holliday junction resolvase RuvX [Pirellulaceae bacterium]|tara:strand:- start:100 stop:525 length:426 start_codon:yes stop_codon:yes gene_type:complete